MPLFAVVDSGFWILWPCACRQVSGCEPLGSALCWNLGTCYAVTYKWGHQEDAYDVVVGNYYEEIGSIEIKVKQKQNKNVIAKSPYINGPFIR